MEMDEASGTFYYMAKMFAKIRCLMNFDDFPFDGQTCYFQLGSNERDWTEEVRIQLSTIPTPSGVGHICKT